MNFRRFIRRKVSCGLVAAILTVTASSYVSADSVRSKAHAVFASAVRRPAELSAGTFNEVGLSIDTQGKMERQGDDKVVETVISLTSIDLVAEPDGFDRT